MVVFIHGRPGLEAGTFLFECAVQPCDRHMAQNAGLDNIRESPVKEAAFGPDGAQPSAFRQQGQRLLHKGHDAPGGPGVATAQPAMPALRLRQHRQQRMAENLNVCLGGPEERVADGVITGKSLHPQQGVQDPVVSQPFEVGEGLGTGPTRIINAGSACASGMALLKVVSAKGMVRWTWLARPILPRNEIKPARPPKGVIALEVSANPSLASPNGALFLFFCGNDFSRSQHHRAEQARHQQRRIRVILTPSCQGQPTGGAGLAIQQPLRPCRESVRIPAPVPIWW